MLCFGVAHLAHSANRSSRHMSGADPPPLPAGATAGATATPLPGGAIIVGLQQKQKKRKRKKPAMRAPAPAPSAALDDVMFDHKIGDVTVDGDGVTWRVCSVDGAAGDTVTWQEVPNHPMWSVDLFDLVPAPVPAPVPEYLPALEPVAGGKSDGCSTAPAYV